MLDLLKKRRSIRVFKNVDVEPEKTEQLICAALLSPSSRRLRPWEFIVVTDRKVLKQLSGAKQGAEFLASAPLGIVVLADPAKCDVWIEDTSIASIIIQLTATSLDLGSCWIQIRERLAQSGQTAEEHVRDVLNIPDNYKVESIVAIGYPAEIKLPYQEKQELQRVHMGVYGTSFNEMTDK